MKMSEELTVEQVGACARAGTRFRRQILDPTQRGTQGGIHTYVNVNAAAGRFCCNSAPSDTNCTSGFRRSCDNTCKPFQPSAHDLLAPDLSSGLAMRSR